MTIRRYLGYVLLNVGGAQRLARTDIADEAVDYLRPMLMQQGPHRLGAPGADFDIVVRHEGPGLIVRVVEAGSTLAMFAVVPRSRGELAVNLWRQLQDSRLDAFAAAAPPEAPWVGLALSAALRDRPRSIVHGIIALCKSGAWAWLDPRSNVDD